MAHSPTPLQIVPFLAQEVRTSLSAVLGFVESMYDSRLSLQERFTSISNVRHTIENTSKLLDDLTHIATVSDGTLSLKSIRFELKDAISWVVTVTKALARKSELGVEVKPIGSLPKYIISDPVRLEECLISISHLLIEKCERGTIQITLQLSEKDPSYVDFVIDSTSNWKPIFPIRGTQLIDSLEFLSVHSLPLIHGKAAISISLAQALSRALGGELSMEPSTLGTGVGFRVSMPLGPFEQLTSFQSDSFDTIPKSQEIHSFVPPDLTGTKFLVVDDDQDILNLIETLLQRAGAQVQSAHNGKECIDYCVSQKYDCIIMDLHLPFFNGINCLSSLRYQGNQTSVIMMTANTTCAARKNAMEAGATRFLTKPIRVETLFKTIENALSNPLEVLAELLH